MFETTRKYGQRSVYCNDGICYSPIGMSKISNYGKQKQLTNIFVIQL